MELSIQSNQITLSKSNFTVPQKRILHAIVETISPILKAGLDQRKGKEVSIQMAFDELCKITYKASDLGTHNNYGEIRTALLQLEDRKYFLETEDSEIRTRLILRSEFKKKSEYINITIDQVLFGMLMDLTKGYTIFQTKVALSFTSIYAMKLYELIAKWRNEPKFYISIDELRRLTDTQEKYLKANDFKKNVLDISKNQMDNLEITDLTFTYKEIKKSRSIVGFEIYPNKTKYSHESQNTRKNNPVSLLWDFDKDLIENFNKYDLIVKGKNLDLMRELKKKIGERMLAEEIHRIAAYAKINNKSNGYVINSLKKLLDFSPVIADIVELTPEQRKLHAENYRLEESRGAISIGELLSNLIPKAE
jgi:plasmid replication initiation protein